MSRAQRWEEMPRHITDDVLHTFVTVGTYEEIVRKLSDRYGKVVTHCEFSIPVKDDGRQGTPARACKDPPGRLYASLITALSASSSDWVDPARIISAKPSLGTITVKQ